MSSKVQAVRGTQSMIGEEAERFHAVVSAFDRVRRLYGFQRVEMPVFEATEVFARSIGETTDIVSKEMYTFLDLSGESVTLRPEFTAGICRAYVSEGWQQYAPIKVGTHGPVFRYERPQKGRFRQFHQLDLEILGSPDPHADVELLVVADQLLSSLAISGVVLQLNTLGDAESRRRWRDSVERYFAEHKEVLSPESRDRLQRNPLRILDSKDPTDRKLAQAAPSIDQFLSSEAGLFFEAVIKGLEDARVAFELNPRLVRGLDYYRHTAFEFVTDQLGAQGTVLAGGRYDGLVESLGGPPTPGVGWAAGIERLMMMEPAVRPLRSAIIIVESDDPGLLSLGRHMLSLLRRTGMPAQIIDEGSVRKRFDRAAKKRADYLLTLLPPVEPNFHQGRLRVKRRIEDRYRSRGQIFKSLRGFLNRSYGVDVEEFRVAVFRGGEVTLLRPAA